ncbi:ATP-binding cassette domain-containing protein [Petrimonas sp.]|uniref:ATP-binding cassette domain-containing protein n=1 Tax=Petrimonas sp. TaxID=2023866 RepID=UPI003F5161BB
MNKFIRQHILQPFAGKWLRGLSLLAFWTVAFIGLPAISGWFLAMSSVVFITANTAFSYLVPSAIIRLTAITRTATRYFERLENHKTTLDAQQRLQLKIFQSVAALPYFKKQVNNNSSLLENSTHGIEQILNHILLWILPFVALIISVILYFVFVAVFSQGAAIEFLLSSAIFLFIIPQLFFRQNGKLYEKLKLYREENNQALIESFRGRIEITKYNLEEKAIGQYNQKLLQLEKTENKLQISSFNLQLVGGFGFSLIATFLLWRAYAYGINAQTAIGIFFGIMAQAELAEMLFSGKSEKSSVAQQIKDINTVIDEGERPQETTRVDSRFEKLNINNLSSTIPETSFRTEKVSLEIRKGEWIALYGETGKGKTTFLNSLFYPEYRNNGTIIWNDSAEISHLPVPECVYVTQKAYLLTGTLRENFEGYNDEEIESALELVDLSVWRSSLPDDLGTWIGENGETLSGGQRKKLLLAQALLKNPQLLVVDEPSAGISTENAIAIFRNIREHYPEMAILMATHLRDFEKVVDRIVEL